MTRRYVRNPATHGLDRRVPEEVLLWSIYEIRRKRRENLSKEDRRKLLKEDEREEREFRTYQAELIAAQLQDQLIPGTRPSHRGEDVKLPLRADGQALPSHATISDPTHLDRPDRQDR